VGGRGRGREEEGAGGRQWLRLDMATYSMLTVLPPFFHERSSIEHIFATVFSIRISLNILFFQRFFALGQAMTF
jgi:hypothetical protein